MKSIVIVLSLCINSCLGSFASVQGTYLLSTCLHDGPCCLQGYVGLEKRGLLSVNLAGFSSECESWLSYGINERVGKFQRLGNSNNFVAPFRIPHASAGNQIMQIRFNGDALTLENTGSSKAISSSNTVYLSSLKQGLIDGTVRDPTLGYQDFPPGKDASLPVSLSIVFLLAIYFVGGSIWNKRDGGFLRIIQTGLRNL